MPTENINRIPTRRSKAPYKRIENDLLRKIRQGVWSVGTQIPSRVQLAKHYGVDLSTVQKAISALLTSEVVKSDGTRGTFVSKVPSESDPEERAAEFDQATDRNDSRPTTATLPSATCSVGVVGRFAPEISELLVPYMIAQAFENSISADKSIRLHYVDCFRDEQYTIPFASAVETLLSEPLNALCVISPEGRDVDELMTLARASRTPILFICPEMLPQPAVQVYIDNRYDGYQAANFFLDMGYRDLLFVTLGRHSWALERLEGVRAAVRHAGLPPGAVRVFPFGDLTDAPLTRKAFRAPLQAWVREELRQGTLPRAIIGANDHVALDILDVVEQFTVSTGRSHFILGFDDLSEARRRGLTTLRPPLFDMGREGARLLGQILRNGEIRGESLHSRLISEIIVRSSTG